MFADFEYNKQEALELNQQQALEQLSSDLKINTYNFNPSNPTNGRQSRIDIDNISISKSLVTPAQHQQYNHQHLMKYKVKQMNDHYEHQKYNQHLQNQQYQHQQQTIQWQNAQPYMSYGAIQNQIQRSANKNDHMTRIGTNQSWVAKKSQIQNNSSLILQNQQTYQSQQQPYQQQPQQYQKTYELNRQ